MQAPRCKAAKKPCLSNYIVALWMLSALYGMLACAVVLLNDAVMLAVLPMGALALLALFNKKFCLHGLFMGPRRDIRLLALGVTVLFFAFLSVPNLLSCPLFSEKGLSVMWWRYRALRLMFLAWNYAGFLLGYVLSVYACAHTVLEKMLLPDKADAPAPLAPVREARYLFLYKEMLPFALLLFAIALASAPSLFVGDAPTVWYNVRDSAWDEWHTAGYTLFVKLCTLIWDSQRCIVFVQAAACLYIHNYALTRLAAACCGGRTRRAYLIAAAAVFVPLYFLQTIIKDVAFSLALYAFSLGVLALVQQEKPRAKDFVRTAFFGLCTCLFRHAGALPVAAAFAGLLIYYICKKSGAVRGVLLAGGSVLLLNVLIVNVLAYRVLDFKRNPSYIAMSAPMTMIGAVAKSGVPIEDGDKAVMERVMPVEKWARCYEPYFADSISRPYGRIGSDIFKVQRENLGGALIRLNARFLMRYPGVYLKAFFDLNSLAWEIATPGDGYVRSYLGYPATAIATLVTDEGYAVEGVDRVTKELKQAEDTTFTGFAPIVNRTAELLYGLPVTRCLLWRGGFANLVLIVCAVVLFKKRRAPELLALVPIAAVTVGMLFSMPAQEVRYIFPNLYCATFFAVYAWAVRPKGDTEAT